MGQKIMVGMSGGVDSSVAACLLLRQGYDVTGVTFKLWDDPAGDSGCCSADDVRDAAFVCEQLGIPHYVINYKELFREKVVAPFAEEYLHGRTPNPCINCNRYIKFGAFSHKLKELGFDLMATGHYARCGYNDATGRWELRRGIYPEKDQSYVLCHLTQEQLATILFRYVVYKGLDLVTLEDNLSRFSDRNEISSYAVSAMNWAVGQGLVKGSGGKLNPKGNATRAQVAAILHRFCELGK